MRGFWIKWVFAACLAGAAYGRFGARGPDGATLAAAALSASVLAGLVWFAWAWATVPEEDRNYTLLGRYTAFSATVRLFVPIYSLYWFFRALGHLCASINDSLARRELTMRAPLALANTAAVLFVIAPLFAWRPDASFLVYLVAGALWFVFTVQADHARRFVFLSAAAEREKIDAERAKLRAEHR